MKPQDKAFLKEFAIELLLYSGLVLLYFFVVLHWLSGWIYGLFVERRGIYAAAALALILGQGILLELLTTALLRFIKRR
jgi:hypothetical protein